MSNHFYRIVLNVQEELNTEDDPCIETTEYNFQVGSPLPNMLRKSFQTLSFCLSLVQICVIELFAFLNIKNYKVWILKQELNCIVVEVEKYPFQACVKENLAKKVGCRYI